MKVCASCFADIEIRNYIESNSEEIETCELCQDNQSYVINMNELQDFFAEFLDIFVPDDELGSPLDWVLSDSWNIFNKKANVKKFLTQILPIVPTEIKAFNQKVLYSPEIEECLNYWDILKEDLKWSRRYLTDIEELFNLEWDTFFDDKTVLGEDQVLYRARIHKKENEDAFSIEEMGCPHPDHSTDGRANPKGIPYLYLSKAIKTTFYETRVTYLDEVSVGSFMANDHVVLVDFMDSGSPFLNMGNMESYVKSRLLKEKISWDLSKPIRRYDSMLEYIPTQFICEFIRYITGAQGIVFESSLHEGGINYVIFDEDCMKCVGVEKHRVTSVRIRAEKENDYISRLAAKFFEKA